MKEKRTVIGTPNICPKSCAFRELINVETNHQHHHHHHHHHHHYYHHFYDNFMKPTFLEKLTGLQPVKKFPEFYGTRTFITAFTTARHLYPN
jgi:hypothetical protein